VTRGTGIAAALCACGGGGFLEVKLMIHQKFGTCVIALTAALLVSSCISLRVTSDVAVGASAAQCHTFGWAGSFHTDGKPRTVANPLNESRLRTAIAANLAAKGVQPASGQASDYSVHDDALAPVRVNQGRRAARITLPFPIDLLVRPYSGPCLMESQPG